MKLSGATVDPSEGFRAQPAIIHYRARVGSWIGGKRVNISVVGGIEWRIELGPENSRVSLRVDLCEEIGPFDGRRVELGGGCGQASGCCWCCMSHGRDSWIRFGELAPAAQGWRVSKLAGGVRMKDRELRDHCFEFGEFSSDGPWKGVIRRGMLHVFFFAVEYAGKIHQHRRGAGRTLASAVADRITILAEIGRRQGDMLQGAASHGFSPILFYRAWFSGRDNRGNDRGCLASRYGFYARR